MHYVSAVHGLLSNDQNGRVAEWSRSYCMLCCSLVWYSLFMSWGHGVDIFGNP